MGAWPAFVGVGAVVALTTQDLLARHHQLPTSTLLVISFFACLLGIVGAKLYHLAGHREEKHSLLLAGMSIQCFVLVAIAIVLLGSLLFGIPVGRMLDVTAPGCCSVCRSVGPVVSSEGAARESPLRLGGGCGALTGWWVCAASPFS